MNETEANEWHAANIGKALAAKDAEIDALQAENERLRAAIVVMCDDGWLMCGVEGMSSAQEICYAAYLTINPTPKEQAT